ncbi:hypothetical protein ACTQ50_01170 [Blautia sp. Sow4_E7]|uniref:hypothetical protein n=1 Tax=Blautia sp. Sow4_E7 TaxID=3438749 RepID=UPI003F906E63
MGWIVMIFILLVIISNYPIVGIVLALLVIGGGVYFYFSSQEEEKKKAELNRICFHNIKSCREMFESYFNVSFNKPLYINLDEWYYEWNYYYISEGPENKFFLIINAAEGKAIGIFNDCVIVDGVEKLVKKRIFEYSSPDEWKCISEISRREVYLYISGYYENGFRPYYEINENKYDGILEWDLKADQIDGWAFSFGIVKPGHDGGDYIQFKKYYY